MTHSITTTNLIQVHWANDSIPAIRFCRRRARSRRRKPTINRTFCSSFWIFYGNARTSIIKFKIFTIRRTCLIVTQSAHVFWSTSICETERARYQKRTDAQISILLIYIRILGNGNSYVLHLIVSQTSFIASVGRSDLNLVRFGASRESRIS